MDGGEGEGGYNTYSVEQSSGSSNHCTTATTDTKVAPCVPPSILTHILTHGMGRRRQLMLANHRHLLFPYFFLFLLLGSSCDTARKTSLPPLPRGGNGKKSWKQKEEEESFPFPPTLSSLDMSPPPPTSVHTAAKKPFFVLFLFILFAALLFLIWEQTHFTAWAEMFLPSCT